MSGKKQDELWDIYDENKQPTGRTMRRNDWNMKPGDYHLTVLAILKRKSDGRYLITQRAADKSWAPLQWEVSGGGVMAGETSFDAVCREVFEETGLDVRNADGGVKLTYRRDNPDEGDNYFVDVYRFALEFTEDDICLQPEETEGFRIATLEEMRAIADEKNFLHYDSIKEAF